MQTRNSHKKLNFRLSKVKTVKHLQGVWFQQDPKLNIQSNCPHLCKQLETTRKEKEHKGRERNSLHSPLHIKHDALRLSPINPVFHYNFIAARANE